MEECHKYSLRANRVFLIRTLDLDRSLLIDFMYSRGILTDFDKGRLEHELVVHSRVRLFLDILRHKSNPNTFQVFLDGLNETKQWHLRQQIEVKAKQWNEKIAKSELSSWLKDTYMLCDEATVSFEDMVAEAAIHGMPEDDKGSRLLAMIQQVFPEARVEKGSDIDLVCKKISGISLKEDQETLLNDIQQEQQNQVSSAQEASSKISSTELSDMQISIQNAKMEDWDVQQVCEWVGQSNLSTKDKAEAADIFKKQEVSGDLLLTFTVSQMPAQLQPLTLGAFWRVLKERDQWMKDENEAVNTCTITTPTKTAGPKVPPYVRRFGTDSPLGCYYEAGVKMPFFSSSPNQNMLVPLHKYIDMSQTSESDRNATVITHLLTFICACLNDRSNGTIHFGVDTDGQIQGFRMNPESMKTIFYRSLNSCFLKDQINTVKMCVHGPAFIQVNNNSDIDVSYVMEVDVMSHAKLCRETAFYVRLPSGLKGNKLGRGKIYRFLDEEPCALDEENIIRFAEEKSHLFQLREDEERKVTQVVNKDHLRDRLVQLLCQGDDSMSADLYHILVLGPLPTNATKNYLKENFSFVKDIQWTAVFDFDPSATMYNFLATEEKRNYRVIVLDEYEQGLQGRENKVEDLEEDYHSGQMLWFFCNGYSEQGTESASSPRQWRREKGNTFQGAFQVICRQIPDERAVVVFALPSDDLVAVTEGACDCCDKLLDQYVVLSEQEENADKLKEVLVQRYLTTFEVANERTVSGIPWKHIQFVIQELTHSAKVDVLQLPTSSGTTCPLDEYTRGGWTDLDILGCNQCECDIAIINDNEARDKQRRDVEEAFFKGQEVCWWNFYFKDQVMQRDIHNNLKKLVQSGLRGELKSMDEDDRTGRVTLYHQAGAGGTTAARNVLWDLRSFNRCAEVITVTDRTADHILEFRRYQDEVNPKPVVVLLDNPEEDKVATLVALIERKVKEDEYYNKDYNINKTGIACVFLICKRATEPPRHAYGDRVLLKQELKKNEVDWLMRTYNRLDQQYTEAQGPNPKYLISLNILKSGFDEEHIKKTAKDLLDHVERPKERLMLKYLAFLNVYDLQRRLVPTAVFNYMMQDMFWTKKKKRSRGERSWGYGSIVSQERHWELGLSDSTKILLNETPSTKFARIKAIGLIHRKLASEVLSVLAESKQGKQTKSEIALEFLNSKEIFNPMNHAKRDLLRLVQDILKQRERNQYGIRATKFAPIIEEIDENETTEKALEVYQKGYELTEDPFLAQQIARYYIKYKNWPKAEEFAKKATDIKRDNSYVWDTYAQVYREQVLEHYNQLVKETSLLSLEEIAQIIELTYNAMKMFKKEQELSDMDTSSSMTNDAGFFGEIRVFTTMLNCMTYMEALSTMNLSRAKDTLQELIAERRMVPPELAGLGNLNEKNYIDVLRDMWKRVQETLGRLEDEQVQLREAFMDDTTVSHRKKTNTDLEKVKRDLDSYFGEDSDQAPESSSEAEACSFRRRRIFKLTGLSLRDVFEMQKKEDNGREILERVQNLLFANIASKFSNADDFRMILCTTLALVSYGAKHLYAVPYEKVVGWTRILYEKRETLTFTALEPYLFYTMMNWPRKNTSDAVPPPEIKEVLKQWTQAYWKKYPRQREEGRLHRKKDTVMFFFSNGSGMNSIKSYYEIKRSEAEHSQGFRTRFWRSSYVLRNLERFKGTLNSEGLKVTVPVKYHGNQYHIDIPTSFPIRDHSKYNKHVWFVIGFSWGGPKAYDVDIKDPTMDENLVAMGHSIPDPNAKQGQSAQNPQKGTRLKTNSHWDFLKIIRNAEADLMKLRTKYAGRGPTEHEKKEEKRLISFIEKLKRDRLEQPLMDA